MRDLQNGDVVKYNFLDENYTVKCLVMDEYLDENICHAKDENMSECWVKVVTLPYMVFTEIDAFNLADSPEGNIADCFA